MPHKYQVIHDLVCKDGESAAGDVVSRSTIQAGTHMATREKPREYRKRRYSQAVLCRRRYRAKMKRAEKVFKLFQRTLSLTKTGEKLGVTRERVRQILEFGHRTGVITYFGKVDTRRLAALLAKTDRAGLARDLAAQTRDEVCAKYGIPDSLSYKLREYAAAGGSLVEL